MLRQNVVSSLRKAVLVGALALAAITQVTAPVAEASQTLTKVDLYLTMGWKKPTVKAGTEASFNITANHAGADTSAALIEVYLPAELGEPRIWKTDGIKCEYPEKEFLVNKPVWKITCSKAAFIRPGDSLQITMDAPERPGTYSVAAKITARDAKDVNDSNNTVGKSLTVTP